MEQRASGLIRSAKENGKELPVGADGILSGDNSEFIIGYDGRTYIEGLSANNLVTISTDNGECVASFGFAAVDDQQVEIGPVICK